MLRKVIIIWCLLHILNAEDSSSHDGPTQNKQMPDKKSGGLWSIRFGKQSDKQCVTGYMTDVQGWVNENGNLHPNLNYQYLIDVSSRQDPTSILQQKIKEHRGVSEILEIKYLSMSNCKLRRVPKVFILSDNKGRPLYSTVEYMTFYGNDFMELSEAGVNFVEVMNATDALSSSDVGGQRPGSTAWAAGLTQVTFDRLRELDLRNCNIQQLTDDLFKNMPTLEALYLGENHISFIAANAFRGLNNLIHLDLSRNSFEMENKGIIFEHRSVFYRLQDLQSLDLSFTLISQRDVNIFSGLKNLTRLSICHTGLSLLPKGVFNETSIRILDVSGNNGIFNVNNPLKDLENTLEILYAKEIGLKTFTIFKRLEKLHILDIDSNEVSGITKEITKSLKSLQILNLDNNRVPAWFDIVFGHIKTLRFLSLRDNNINMISVDMIEDIQNVSYVGLSGNFIICNCHARELFEIAYRNENMTFVRSINRPLPKQAPFQFHRGFDDFEKLIVSRKSLVRICDGKHCKNGDDLESDGNFKLFDFNENLYHCLEVAASTSVPFSQVNTCAQMRREANYFDVINGGRNKIWALIAIPVILFPILIFCYIFRRNLRYFCITIRNSATLSLINKNEAIDVSAGNIFHYDVFVSYCNNDRNWVLDEVLPNVEKGCNISVCLHERDFQVGLSILENIVSCMDRSRSIMLIISKQFLLSQWCQFEMHLAQHRLLETRREDLILVLLEDIPRRLRPTTLHYLMLTKTYIVWPKKESEKPAFWKRLSKSILARRQISHDNISLA